MTRTLIAHNILLKRVIFLRLSECLKNTTLLNKYWRRHDMETISELLANFEGNPPVTIGFPSQRASNVDILWRHCNRTFAALHAPRRPPVQSISALFPLEHWHQPAVLEPHLGADFVHSALHAWPWFLVITAACELMCCRAKPQFWSYGYNTLPNYKRTHNSRFLERDTGWSRNVNVWFTLFYLCHCSPRYIRPRHKDIRDVSQYLVNSWNEFLWYLTFLDPVAFLY